MTYVDFWFCAKCWNLIYTWPI